MWWSRDGAYYNERQALAELAEAGVLTTEETDRLFTAYDFLRLLINAMRISVQAASRGLTSRPS